MVQGCLEWQRIGLNPPAAVRAATAAYLTHRTQSAPGWRVSRNRSQQLREARRPLCVMGGVGNAAGEPVGASRSFYRKLEGRGYGQTTYSGQRRFVGLRLKPQPGSTHRTDYDKPESKSMGELFGAGWCSPGVLHVWRARTRDTRRNQTNLHQPAPRQTKLELRRACLRLQAGSPTHLRRFSLSLVPVLGTRTLDRFPPRAIAGPHALRLTVNARAPTHCRPKGRSAHCGH